MHSVQSSKEAVPCGGLHAGRQVPLLSRLKRSAVVRLSMILTMGVGGGENKELKL